MGRLGHFQVSSAWGIPSLSYIKSLGSHITMVQMLLMEGQSFHLSQGNIVVFSPHERLGLILKVHSELEHFGVKRTYSHLAPHYHWRGMYADVIARCEQCDRMRTSFSSR